VHFCIFSHIGEEMFYNAMDQAVEFIDVHNAGWEKRLYDVASAVNVNPRIHAGRLEVLLNLADRLKAEKQEQTSKINQILSTVIKAGANKNHRTSSTAQAETLQYCCKALFTVEFCSLLYIIMRVLYRYSYQK
jgi:hypothetical protein